MTPLVVVCLLLPLRVCAAGVPGDPGFASLFDGHSLQGWVIEGDPASWSVADGCLRSDGSRGAGTLRSERAYGNFVLQLEWRLSKVGNSGIYLREFAGAPGYEVQLLAPWTPHRDDLHCTASIYGHVAPNPRPDETPERWRTMEITCAGRLITVAVDGTECTRADMDEVESLRGASMWGYIGLQSSHSGPEESVEFRSIRLKDLDRDATFVAGQLRSPDGVARGRAIVSAAALGVQMVGPLMDLASGDALSLRTAREAMERLVARAGAPGADAGERTAVAAALVHELQSAKADVVRSTAARMLGLLGETDLAVPALVEALPDLGAHGAARGALEILPGEAPSRALLRAIDGVAMAFQPGVIHSLGARRYRPAVPRLIEATRVYPDASRAAALEALAAIGDPRGAKAIVAVLRDGPEGLRPVAGRAALALAERVKAERRGLALQLYGNVVDRAALSSQREAAALGIQNLAK